MDPQTFGFSALGAFAVAPILRIQTILQTQDLIPSLRGGRNMKGAIDCFQRIRKEEGARYLWRGTVPLLCIKLLHGLFEFMRVADYKETITEIDESTEKAGENAEHKKTVVTEIELFNQTDPNENPLAGPGVPLSVFVLFAGLFIHPFEVLRTRLAADYGAKPVRQYTGVFNAANSLVKAGGIKALYRGYIPLITFSIIEENTNNFTSAEYNEDLPIKQFTRDLLLFPLIVVSNRLIMQTGNPFGKYKGVVDCVQSTYKEFGIRGFYRGFQINFALYALSASTYLIAEGLKKFTGEN